MAKSKKIKSVSGSMRFYDKSEVDIQDFLSKIRAVAPNVLDIKEVPMTMSVNMFVDDGREFDLYFKTQKELEVFFTNPNISKLYSDFIGSKTILRKPGDKAWAV